MKYNLIALPKFSKSLKQLAKKYPSIKSDLKNLFDSLEKNPTQGVNLGNNCFKIRLAISSKGKGKSGGSRVITHIVVSEETVYLIYIYDKSEKDALTDSELRELLKDLQ